MITKGDLLRVVLAAAADPGVWGQPVARWMAHGVLALRARDSIQTAAGHLVESGLRSLPVIDDDGQVLGMVSRNDVMGAIGGGMAAAPIEAEGGMR
jgi:CBS domain-containing protein